MKFFIKFIVILILLIAVFAGAFYGAHQLYPQKYSEFIEQSCDEYDVPIDLAYAVIKCESGFDPNAKSEIGAIGLMQITPETFEWILTKIDDKNNEMSDLYDPKTNIRAGIYLLKLNLADFESTEFALAAYHAGRAKTQSWIDEGIKSEDIPYSDTNAYIKRVMITSKIYNLLYQ